MPKLTIILNHHVCNVKVVPASLHAYLMRLEVRKLCMVLLDIYSELLGGAQLIHDIHFIEQFQPNWIFGLSAFFFQLYIGVWCCLFTFAHCKMSVPEGGHVLLYSFIGKLLPNFQKIYQPHSVHLPTWLAIYTIFSKHKIN